MVGLWESKYLWKAHGRPLGIRGIILWKAYGRPVGILGEILEGLWPNYGNPCVNPIAGILGVILWKAYGRPVAILEESQCMPLGYPMEGLWPTWQS